MIETTKLEATLNRLSGFERLVSCDRLSAGASRETYRLLVVMDGAERKLALRRAAGEGVEGPREGRGAAEAQAGAPQNRCVEGTS